MSYWGANVGVVIIMKIIKRQVDLARWICASTVLAVGVTGCGGNASQDPMVAPTIRHARTVSEASTVSLNPQPAGELKTQTSQDFGLAKEASPVASKTVQFGAQALTDVVSGSVYHWARCPFAIKNDLLWNK